MLNNSCKCQKPNETYDINTKILRCGYTANIKREVDVQHRVNAFLPDDTSIHF